MCVCEYVHAWCQIPLHFPSVGCPTLWPRFVYVPFTFQTCLQSVSRMCSITIFMHASTIDQECPTTRVLLCIPTHSSATASATHTIRKQVQHSCLKHPMFHLYVTGIWLVVCMCVWVCACVMSNSFTFSFHGLSYTPATFRLCSVYFPNMPPKCVKNAFYYEFLCMHPRVC